MKFYAKAPKRGGVVAMLPCPTAPLRDFLVSVVSIVVTLIGGGALAVDVRVDTVLDKLRQPCGVVVRPGGTADRYELMIAESGAGKIVLWSSAAPAQTVDVVTGFASQVAVDPLQQKGPVALSFLDPGMLVVGAASDGTESLLRTYELPEGGKVLEAAEASESNAESKALAGETCIAMTRSRANGLVPDLLVLVVHRIDGSTQLMKARVQAGIVGAPQVFGSADATTSTRAVTLSNSGRVVVVDAAGELTFYNPIDGNVDLQLSTDVQQPAALAYSPTTGSLYVADAAGSIHRIDDASVPGRPECRAVKIAEVDGRPTALAFAPDGALYVTTFGSGDGDGALQVITGDL